MGILSPILVLAGSLGSAGLLAAGCSSSSGSGGGTSEAPASAGGGDANDGAAPPIVVVPEPDDAGLDAPDTLDGSDGSVEAMGGDAGLADGEAGAAMEASTDGAASVLSPQAPQADGGAGAAVEGGDAAALACAAPDAICGGTCVDTQTDLHHCGACGTVCTGPLGGQAVCAGGGCTFECNAGYLPCSGGCIDPTSDAASCGTCGHSCGAGACAAGQCQPWVVAANVAAQVFACDGTDATWAPTASGQVLEAPVRAGASDASTGATALWPNASGQVHALAMAGGVTVWTGMNTSGSGSALYESSAPDQYGYEVTGGLDPTSGLAIDVQGASAYFATVNGTTASIWQCDVAATAPSCRTLTTVASTQIAAMAVDDQSVYWTDPANAVVSRYALGQAGSTPVTVATIAQGQRNVGPLAVDGANVYWATTVDGAAYTLRAAAKGGTTVTVLGSTTSAVAGIASDGAHLYVATEDGIIESVPVGGGSVATLHVTNTPQHENSDVLGVTYAAGALYWNDLASGILGMRVP